MITSTTARPTEATNAAGTPATEKVASAHKWSNMSAHDLHREFMHSRFYGSAIFTKDRSRVPQGLGVWKWDKFGAHSTPYVSLTILEEPMTEHYGMRSREAVLAHMIVHVEAGTQCLSAEPKDWDDAEREVEYEAMHRMDWAPFCCDKWDDKLQGFIPYERAAAV